MQEAIVVKPAQSLTPQQSGEVSDYAVKALMHIARARAAIHEKKQTDVDKELKKALAYLALAKTKLPTSKIIDEVNIAKAHIKFAETETVVEDLVPIYSDLTVVGELIPVQQANDKLNEAKAALKQGNKKAAEASLNAIEESLIYTEVDLPVASTERYIKAALKYVAHDDLAKADKTLRAAEDNLQFLSFDMESPIAEARDNLSLASQNYTTKHYSQVKKNLIAAKKWLEVARASVDRDSAATEEYEAINQLEGDVEKMSVRLDKKDTSLAASLEGALHKLNAMAETEAEKIVIGWKDKRPDTDVRADLIEAKQHVAFAENMQFYAHSDPADVFKSLDQAKADLENVAHSGKLSDKAFRTLETVRKDLETIRKTPGKRGTYERIRAHLRELIHNRF